MIAELKLVDSTTEKIFQVPAGKNYAVFNVSFVNISGLASSINMWIVKDGDTLGTDNLFLQQKALTAGNVYTYKEKILLGEGDKISFKLDAGVNQVNVFINFLEV